MAELIALPSDIRIGETIFQYAFRVAQERDEALEQCKKLQADIGNSIPLSDAHDALETCQAIREQMLDEAHEEIGLWMGRLNITMNANALASKTLTDLAHNPASVSHNDIYHALGTLQGVEQALKEIEKRETPAPLEGDTVTVDKEEFRALCEAVVDGKYEGITRAATLLGHYFGNTAGAHHPVRERSSPRQVATSLAKEPVGGDCCGKRNQPQ